MLEQDALSVLSALTDRKSEPSTKGQPIAEEVGAWSLAEVPRRAREAQRIALTTVGLKTWDIFHKAFEEPNVR